MTTPARKFVSFRHADGVATVELVNAKSMNILGSGAIEELTGEFQRLAHRVAIAHRRDHPHRGAAALHEGIPGAPDLRRGWARPTGLIGLLRTSITTRAVRRPAVTGWVD